MEQINLVILQSKNGRDGWEPVKPDDVPWWVKDPVNMGRMVKGETCMKCDEGPKGSPWYRGLTPEGFARWLKAQEKRKARMEKRQKGLH